MSVDIACSTIHNPLTHYMNSPVTHPGSQGDNYVLLSDSGVKSCSQNLTQNLLLTLTSYKLRQVSSRVHYGGREPDHCLSIFYLAYCFTSQNSSYVIFIIDSVQWSICLLPSNSSVITHICLRALLCFLILPYPGSRWHLHCSCAGQVLQMLMSIRWWLASYLG